jgi:hypothetical protein
VLLPQKVGTIEAGKEIGVVVVVVVVVVMEVWTLD